MVVLQPIRILGTVSGTASTLPTPTTISSLAAIKDVVVVNEFPIPVNIVGGIFPVVGSGMVTVTSGSSQTNLRLRPDYATVGVAALYSSNVAVGDHIKFTEITSSGLSGAILPDTTSAYSSSAGASLGRIRLAPNRTYELQTAVCGQLNAASSQFIVQWATDSGVAVGSMSMLRPMNASSLFGSSATAVAFVSPGVTTNYEVRIVAVVGTIAGITIEGTYASVKTID